MAEAIARTIRVQLLKIAAYLAVPGRRVHVRLCSAFPHRDVFARLHAQLLARTDPD
jgi:hypothetical protein